MEMRTFAKDFTKLWDTRSRADDDPGYDPTAAVARDLVIQRRDAIAALETAPEGEHRLLAALLLTRTRGSVGE